VAFLVVVRLTGKSFDLGLDTLVASTRAIESGSPSNDSTYTRLEAQICNLTQDRNAVADQMRDMLENAEFKGQPSNQRQARSLIRQGERLLERAEDLSGHSR
jgi:acetyl/propionyl-CoA carboxylase alpha subunit